MTGPHITSWSRDATHDYREAPTGVLVLALIGILAALCAALVLGQRKVQPHDDFCARNAAPGWVEQCRAEVGAP